MKSKRSTGARIGCCRPRCTAHCVGEHHSAKFSDLSVAAREKSAIAPFRSAPRRFRRCVPGASGPPERCLARGRRPVAESVIAIMLALVALGYASPPDPLWIAGIYDDGDYDDVVGMVTDASGTSDVRTTSPVECALVRGPLPSPASDQLPNPTVLGLIIRGPPTETCNPSQHTALILPAQACRRSIHSPMFHLSLDPRWSLCAVPPHNTRREPAIRRRQVDTPSGHERLDPAAACPNRQGFCQRPALENTELFLAPSRLTMRPRSVCAGVAGTESAACQSEWDVKMRIDLTACL